MEQLDLQNKKILITGATGRSGMAAVQLVMYYGGIAHLSDCNTGDLPLKNSLQQLTGTYRDFRPRDDVDLIDEIKPDFIITAPGMPLTAEIFKRAAERHIPVYGEQDFAARVLMQIAAREKRRIEFIGITGTDGKTTTTSLIEHILNHLPIASDKNGPENVSDITGRTIKSIACGNIGLPLSQLAFEIEISASETWYDIFIVECSSFQLEPITFFHPSIAMILNLSDDHLDRYNDMQNYLLAKLGITRNQLQDDLFIISPDIAERIIELNKGIPQKISPAVVIADENSNAKDHSDLAAKCFQLRELHQDFWSFFEQVKRNFKPAGRHNLQNLIFTLITVMEIVRKSKGHSFKSFFPDKDILDCIEDSVASFEVPPHRLQFIKSLNMENGFQGEVLFYNDSKATTVQSVLSAISSFDKRQDSGVTIHLLCGGKYKGGDFSVIKSENVRIYAFGEAAETIVQMAEGQDYVDLEEAFFASMESARRIAREKKNQKQYILLSPGCASFDQYRNYIARGEHFLRLVNDTVR